MLRQCNGSVTARNSKRHKISKTLKHLGPFFKKYIFQRNAHFQGKDLKAILQRSRSAQEIPSTVCPLPTAEPVVVSEQSWFALSVKICSPVTQEGKRVWN